jgi:hypothetical protein
MSRTKRTSSILLNNWSWKCNANRDFKAACITDHDGDMAGYTPKSRHTRAGLLSSWNDVYPSAVYEVKYAAQCK